MRHEIFFGAFDMRGGCKSPPPGKHTSGTFMSSNDLVTHQTHKNGLFHDLKWSKFLFNCKRDSRITQKFEVFQNFRMTLKMFLDIVGVITTSKLGILKTFQGGGLFQPHLISNRVSK